MIMPTAADNGKTVACKCRASETWRQGTVHVSGGAISILINGVLQPLRAFTEYNIIG